MTISHLEKCEFDYLRVTKQFVRKGNSTTTFSNAYKIRSVKKGSPLEFKSVKRYKSYRIEISKQVSKGPSSNDTINNERCAVVSNNRFQG